MSIEGSGMNAKDAELHPEEPELIDESLGMMLKLEKLLMEYAGLAYKASGLLVSGRKY